ncbi:MAG: hypothetical protein QME77_13485 [bacterium]|nr:hypothetical protein [bacterium]
MSESRTVEFVMERETKNTIKYEEQPGEGAPIIGSLYVQKWWAKGARKLRVVVEKTDPA